MEFLYQLITIGSFSFPLWMPLAGVGGLVVLGLMVFTGKKRVNKDDPTGGFGDWTNDGA